MVRIFQVFVTNMQLGQKERFRFNFDTILLEFLLLLILQLVLDIGVRFLLNESEANVRMFHDISTNFYTRSYLKRPCRFIVNSCASFYRYNSLFWLEEQQG